MVWRWACLKIGNLVQFMAFQFQGNFVGKDDDKTVGLGVPCSDKPLICRRSFDVPTGKSTTWGTYRDVFLFFWGMVVLRKRKKPTWTCWSLAMPKMFFPKNWTENFGRMNSIARYRKVEYFTSKNDKTCSPPCNPAFLVPMKPSVYRGFP